MVQTAQGRKTTFILLACICGLAIIFFPGYYKDYKRIYGRKITPRQSDDLAIQQRLEKMNQTGGTPSSKDTKVVNRSDLKQKGQSIMDSTTSLIRTSFNMEKDPFSPLHPEIYDQMKAFKPEKVVLPPPREFRPALPPAKRSVGHLKLQSIVSFEGQIFAMINNRKVYKSDKIDDGAFTVAEITTSQVKLRNAVGEEYYLPERGAPVQQAKNMDEKAAGWTSNADKAILPPPLWEELYEIAPPQNPNILNER